MTEVIKNAYLRYGRRWKSSPDKFWLLQDEQDNILDSSREKQTLFDRNKDKYDMMIYTARGKLENQHFVDSDIRASWNAPINCADLLGLIYEAQSGSSGSQGDTIRYIDSVYFISSLQKLVVQKAKDAKQERDAAMYVRETDYRE